MHPLHRFVDTKQFFSRVGSYGVKEPTHTPLPSAGLVKDG